jgi:hypothetical protein
MPRSAAVQAGSDETMLYVHVSEAHDRELPELVRLAGHGKTDPDTRILQMLSARGSQAEAERRKLLNFKNLGRAQGGTRTPTVLPTSPSN